MRCTSARRLMLLYREGELPAARAAALSRHSTSCPGCASLAYGLKEEFAPLDALRGRRPVLDDPRALTMSIVRGVEAYQQQVAHAGSRGSTVERTLSLARRATGVALASLALLYVSLSTRDARTVASLERHLRERIGDGDGSAEQLAREAASLAQSRKAGAFDESGIRPDDVGRMLEYLVRPGETASRVTVEDVLLRKYPDLASVTLQDGLDDRERIVLADEGERFLKDIEKLMRKEKEHHDK